MRYREMLRIFAIVSLLSVSSDVATALITNRHFLTSAWRVFDLAVVIFAIGIGAICEAIDMLARYRDTLPKQNKGY